MKLPYDPGIAPLGTDPRERKAGTQQELVHKCSEHSIRNSKMVETTQTLASG